MDIVFATNNKHKIKEIDEKLGSEFNLIGLADLQIVEEIPEDFETLEENASQKARYIFDKYHLNCIADDTGLEVDALDGAPGVYSARYSRMGTPVYTDLEISKANVRKLLDQLGEGEERKARFRTVIALIMEGREHRFEGVVSGRIATQPSGSQGFGYDPVFIPDGHNRTFAEMDLVTKNSISHRARAVEKLVAFLRGMK
jgi:XTP/dITP diphosphohydrolase